MQCRVECRIAGIARETSAPLQRQAMIQLRNREVFVTDSTAHAVLELQRSLLEHAAACSAVNLGKQVLRFHTSSVCNFPGAGVLKSRPASSSVRANRPEVAGHAGSS